MRLLYKSGVALLPGKPAYDIYVELFTSPPLHRMPGLLLKATTHENSSDDFTVYTILPKQCAVLEVLGIIRYIVSQIKKHAQHAPCHYQDFEFIDTRHRRIKE